MPVERWSDMDLHVRLDARKVLEFEELARKHPNFQFWPTLSRPETEWRGRVGHVQEHLFEAIGERRDVNVFVCGLKAMVDDVRSRLKAEGFDRKRIVYEKYD